MLLCCPRQPSQDFQDLVMQVESVAFALKLSAEIITFFKTDLLQLRCSSRRCLAFMAAMQTKLSHPFQTPSALRFWQVTLLVESMCDWLPHMKVGHPLYTRLRLRSTCRRILQATHAPLVVYVAALCQETKRHAQRFAVLNQSQLSESDRQVIWSYEWCRNQQKALKRIRDSGFLYHVWLPFANGSRGVLCRDGDLLTISPDTGLPHGMTQDYWKARMPPIKKFGWYEGKLNL